MDPFTLYVPAGWLRCDLGAAVPSLSRTYAQQASAALPVAVRAPVREVLESTLLGALAALGEGGAVTAVLPSPVATWPGVTAIGVVMPLQAGEPFRPLDLVLGLAARDRSAQIVDVPGLVALRTCTTTSSPDLLAEAAAEAGEILGAQATAVEDADVVTSGTVTRVRYLIGEPDDRDRWADVLFTVQAPATVLGAELAEAAVAVFDAMVSTFSWLEEAP